MGHCIWVIEQACHLTKQAWSIKDLLYGIKHQNMKNVLCETKPVSRADKIAPSVLTVSPSSSVNTARPQFEIFQQLPHSRLLSSYYLRDIGYGNTFYKVK